MRRGQPRQALVAPVPEHFELPPQHLARRRPAELAADLVGLGQQADVGRRVDPREGPTAVAAATVLDPPRLPVLGDETGHLRAGESRRLAEILAHRALPAPVQRRVAQTHQRPAREPVRGLPALGLEVHLRVAAKEGLDLLHRAEPFGL